MVDRGKGSVWNRLILTDSQPRFFILHGLDVDRHSMDMRTHQTNASIILNLKHTIFFITRSVYT